MKKGINKLFNFFEVRDYDFQIQSGGPIYIENKFEKNEQSQNIKIYIEGGNLFPLFRDNVNENEFRNFLSEYAINYKNNINKYFNIAEMESERIMITVNATEAYENYVSKFSLLLKLNYKDILLFYILTHKS